MKCKLAIKVVMAFSLAWLLGCDKDTDTPADMKRASYVDARMLKAGSETVFCDGSAVILPNSENTETLAQYILKIHSANRKSIISEMDVASLQELYRKCLRPILLKRLSKPRY